MSYQKFVSHIAGLREIHDAYLRKSGSFLNIPYSIAQFQLMFMFQSKSVSPWLCRLRFPNFGMIPHPELLSEERLKEFEKRVDALDSEENLRKVKTKLSSPPC
jgi:hypothetical protein